MISVIIPCYQDSKAIGPCLKSIFGQSRKDVEVIIVDDGSTDDLRRALSAWEGRVKMISQENRGGNAARNRGFDASSGEFVMFCDADMRLRPDALDSLAAALEAHPEASYAYSSFRFGWKAFRCGPFDAERLRAMNYISTASLIRRAHFPRFDESLRRFQDWDLWLTMLEQGGTGVWVPETLFQAEVKQGNISAWLPSFVYRLPWKIFGWRPKRVERYEDAADIVRKKHGLITDSI